MKIEYIKKCNQNNTNGLNNWCKYLDWLKQYISNRSIAFDYANRCSKFPNGTYFLNDFNIGVGYTIKTNEYTRQSYVYIFKLNMRLDEFGLKLPNITENNNTKTQDKKKKKIRLTEEELHRIIRKSVINILRESSYSVPTYRVQYTQI